MESQRVGHDWATSLTQVALVVKNPPANAEDKVLDRFLGQEDALEEAWQFSAIFLHGNPKEA